MIQELADKLRQAYLDPDIQDDRWTHMAKAALRFQSQLTTIEVPHGSEITIIHKGISPMPTDKGVADLRASSPSFAEVVEKGNRLAEGLASSPEVVHTPSPKDMAAAETLLRQIANEFGNTILDTEFVRARVTGAIQLITGKR